MVRSSAAVAAVAAGGVLALLTGTPAVADSGPGGAGPREFHVEAHRGATGEVVESTLPSFARALETGVRSIELDVMITKDAHAVITHDRQVQKDKCLDTKPAHPNDPDFPYVGEYVRDLTLRQVRTLDCGTLTQDEQFPGQESVPGARMLELSEFFDLVHRYRAYDVELTLELKVEAGAPEETAPRELFVRRAAREIRESGLREQISVRSFDWGTLMRFHEVEPGVPRIALVEPNFLEVGEPGASPWLGGIDIDDFDGDPVAAVASFGAEGFAPLHGEPQDATVEDPDYVPFTTADMVDRAHEAGMSVVVWTVDDRATMGKLMDDGVDGITTDYPGRLREVAAAHGYDLPRPYPPP